jgi:hypothetical protein
MKNLWMAFCLLFLVASASDLPAARPTARAAGTTKKARSASGSSGSSGAKASTRRAGSSSSSGGAKSGSVKGGSKKSKSKSSSSDDEAAADPALSGPEGCLGARLPELLSSSCGFLVDGDISAGLAEPLLCVYNSKDSGSTKGVYTIYLRQYWGISEGNVKANSSIADVKDQTKGMLMYWKYLINEVKGGTLKENKIFDSITEVVLEDSSLSSAEQIAIEKKSVETVPLSLPIVKSDLESCTKAAKAAMTECKAVGDMAVKKKITASCTAYEALLVKMAGAKKAEAMGNELEFSRVLQERLRADIDATKAAQDREKERADLEMQATLNMTNNEISKTKSKRAELVIKASEIMGRISDLEPDDADGRADYGEELAEINGKICDLDKSLRALDSGYAPLDNLGCNSASAAAPAAETVPALSDEQEGE